MVALVKDVRVSQALASQHLPDLQREARRVWRQLVLREFPHMRRVGLPLVTFNTRISRRVGLYYPCAHEVQLSLKVWMFSPEHRRFMVDVVLPHEFAHAVDLSDYARRGWPEGHQRHGKPWQDIMMRMGQQPTACPLPDAYGLSGWD